MNTQYNRPICSACNARPVIAYHYKGQARYRDLCYKCARSVKTGNRLGPKPAPTSKLCITCNRRVVMYYVTKSGKKYSKYCVKCARLEANNTIYRKKITDPDRPMCKCGDRLVAFCYYKGVRKFRTQCPSCIRATRVELGSPATRPLCQCGKKATWTKDGADGIRQYLNLCRDCIVKGEATLTSVIRKSDCIMCHQPYDITDRQYSMLCPACITKVKEEGVAINGVTIPICPHCNVKRVSFYYKDHDRSLRYFKPLCNHCESAVKPAGKIGRPRKDSVDESMSSSYRQLHIMWPKSLPHDTTNLICKHRYEFIRTQQKEYGPIILPLEITYYSGDELEQLLRTCFKRFYEESYERISSYTYFFSVRDRATYDRIFPFRPMRLKQLWGTVLNQQATGEYLDFLLQNNRHKKRVPHKLNAVLSGTPNSAIAEALQDH